MQLIIETPDEKVLQAILELIRPFKVNFQQVKDDDTISVGESKRRPAILGKPKSDQEHLTLTHLASERSLAKDWLTETEDEAWQNL